MISSEPERLCDADKVRPRSTDESNKDTGEEG